MDKIYGTKSPKLGSRKFRGLCPVDFLTITKMYGRIEPTSPIKMQLGLSYYIEYLLIYSLYIWPSKNMLTYHKPN